MTNVTFKEKPKAGCGRRDFLKAGAAAAAGAVLSPAGAFAGGTPAEKRPAGMEWIIYQQLGSHMWPAHVRFPFAENGHYCGETTPVVDASWKTRMEAAVRTGCTMMVVDLAEGLHYKSHPEIALKGSRSGEWMNARVRWLRERGVTAVPALNFSTAHGYWLGKYSRMVSSPDYYRVCEDLIREAYDVFENPPYFNFGMDEENIDGTKPDLLSVRRQGVLMWHDIAFFQKVISKCGARPWMWSDYEWWGAKRFADNVSREIVQSNWYYGWDFDYRKMPDNYRFHVESFVRLDKAGFDQFPGCSNWMSGKKEVEGFSNRKTTRIAGLPVNLDNIPNMVRFCKETLDPRRLKGFACFPWGSTVESFDPVWVNACEQFEAARKIHYARS